MIGDGAHVAVHRRAYAVGVAVLTLGLDRTRRVGPLAGEGAPCRSPQGRHPPPVREGRAVNGSSFFRGLLVLAPLTTSLPASSAIFALEHQPRSEPRPAWRWPTATSRPRNSPSRPSRAPIVRGSTPLRSRARSPWSTSLPAGDPPAGERTSAADRAQGRSGVRLFGIDERRSGRQRGEVPTESGNRIGPHRSG